MGDFDDLIAAKKASAPPPATAAPAHRGGGAFDDLIAKKKPTPPANVFAPVASAVGNVASGLSRALDAQRWGLAKALTGEGDPDKQMENLRRGIGVEGAYEAAGRIPVVGHAIQGVTDAVLGGAADPLTYETLGVGPVLRATGIGAKLAPGFIKAVNATPLTRRLYDLTHWGGQVAREQGLETREAIRGATLRASAEGSLVQKKLAAQFDAAVKPLTDADKVEVGRALNGEILPEELTPENRTAYKTLRGLTEADYQHRYTAAQRVLFREFSKGLQPYEKQELAEAVKSGVQPQEITLAERYLAIQRHLEQGMPKREHYIPVEHPKELAADRPAGTIDRSRYFDPHSITREDVKITSPEQVETGFAGMAKNAGRQVQTGLIHEALGELLDDPAVAKLLNPAYAGKGAARTDWEKIKDGWRAAVGYPRAAIVSLTPRHAVNILDLLVNTVPPQQAPKVLRETMGLAAKLFKAQTPEEYEALTREGRELGAIGGDFRERQAFFQPDSPDRVSRTLSKVPGLSAWTKMNNKLVWSVDEAAKIAYAKALVETGEAKGLAAGGTAASRLVDYENVSPLVEALRYVAPFGTFRAGIPGAVLGGVARNPARAAFINRATGGTAYGDQPKPGASGISLSNPTADIGRALTFTGGGGARKNLITSGPGNYLRGSAAAPVQAVGMAAQDILAPSSQPAHWAGYGSHWLPRRDPRTGKWDIGFILDSALAGVPEAQALANALGVGRFPFHGIPQEAARQALGVNNR